MIESAVTSEGQTTLPQAVRDALSVKPGDKVRYIVHGDEVRITKVKPIGRLFGALKHEGPPVSLQDMEQAIVEGTTGK